MTNAPDTARFAHVTEWVFDLDNTLYPHRSNLFSQIDVKMTAYVSELLQLPRDEARKLQKELYKDYGTTLNGLMAAPNLIALLALGGVVARERAALLSEVAKEKLGSKRGGR